MKRSPSYPIQYIEPVILRDGSLIQLRPIHQDDSAHVPMMKLRVSKESLYQRFMGIVKIDEEMIRRFTQLDYQREMAIVAEIKDDVGEKQLVGVARIASIDSQVAEFAILIQDDWHGKGLGKILTKYVIDIAQDLGYSEVHASLFSTNKAMMTLLKKNDFVTYNNGQGVIKAELHLKPIVI